MADSRSTDADDGNRPVRSLLQDAADEAHRRRRLVRWALIVLGGALLALVILLMSTPT
jgi:hypothetical protein